MQKSIDFYKQNLYNVKELKETKTKKYLKEGMKQKMKEEFLKLLRTVNREGIEELINFLEKSDFFKAPASTRFHGDHEGGLVEHSLKVYEIFKT